MLLNETGYCAIYKHTFFYLLLVCQVREFDEEPEAFKDKMMEYEIAFPPR